MTEDVKDDSGVNEGAMESEVESNVVASKEADTASEEPTEEIETSGEATAEEEKPKKKPGGWQRKIARLEYEKAELQRQLSDKEQAELESKAPNWDDFKTVDDWQKATIEYAKKVAESQYKQPNRSNEPNAWEQQIDNLGDEYSDYEEVVRQAPLVENELLLQAIVSSDVGAKLAYYLAKNPAEITKLAKANAATTIREFTRLESLIRTQEESKAVVKKVSKSPPVLKTVKATGSTIVDLDSLSADDYITTRRAAKKSGR